MKFWLETDLKKRTDSHETYYNYCGIVKNHIIPILGKKKMMDVTRGDVQKLFNIKADYSRPIAELVKTIMNTPFPYAAPAQVPPIPIWNRASQSRKTTVQIRLQDPKY